MFFWGVVCPRWKLNWTLHRNEELKEICMVECGNIAVLMYWKWFETKNSHLERWTDSDRLIMIDYDCLVDWLWLFGWLIIWLIGWLIMIDYDWWLIVIDWLVTCCLHDFTAFWIGWLDRARIHCTWERFLCIYPTIGGYQTKIIRKYQRHTWQVVQRKQLLCKNKPSACWYIRSSYRMDRIQSAHFD